MTQARFIFRWDDISPFQDAQRFHRLKDIFVQYHIPAVLGVIPDNRDESIRFNPAGETTFVDDLKKLEKAGWEIAMHGYRHIRLPRRGDLIGVNQVSESTGRPYHDQLIDMERGRNILSCSGFAAVTYITAWHACDEMTLWASGGMR